MNDESKTRRLPESWIEVPLGEVIQLQYGKSLTAKSRVESGLFKVFGSSGNVGNHNQALVTEPCIIVGRKGSVGNVFISEQPCWPIDTVYFVVPPVGIDIKFIFYQMINLNLAQLDKSTAIPGLNRDDAYKSRFNLAPQVIQTQIVQKIEELFSHIDAGVEGLKQAKAKLQQYRQSVLKDAVTGKLTEQWREKNADKLEPASLLLDRILDERRANWEAEQLKAFEDKGQLPKNDKWKDKYKEPENPETNEVPEIPREWVYLRLEALAAIQGGITVDAKRKHVNTTSVPYLRVANVQRGYLDLSEIKHIQVPNDKLDSLLLENGDILFNEGGDRDKLGRGWIWRSEIDKCTYQNHVFRARLFSSDIVPEFVSIFGNTIGKEYFIKQGKQTTNLASINKTKLSAFPVPVCSKEEMLEIMEIVDGKITKTDRMINEVDAQLVRATGLKFSILSKAFTGQLVENTASEETAERLLEKVHAEKAQLDQKAKLTKKKPTARTKKMTRRPILDVLMESKKALNVDELFELSGFQSEVTPETVEEFYQELKDVSAIKGVKITPVKVDDVKQGDLFEYKEVNKNEA